MDWVLLVFALVLLIAVLVNSPLKAFITKNNDENEETCVHTAEDCEGCVSQSNCKLKNKNVVKIKRAK